jgi:major capsid protein
MSLVFPQELTYLNRRAVERYRPLKWRGILPVESAPDWAEVIEDRRERSFVEEPTNTTDKGPTEGLPEPAFSVTNGYIKVYNFGYAYSFTDDEIAKAAHLGIPLQQKKVDAVTLGAEQFLETVASAGHAATGMLGLNTLTDTTAVTAVTKTGGGTAWSATATSAEIVADLHALADGVTTASLETAECDTIVLRLPQYQVANVRMSSALERTPLEIFRAQRPEVRRILVWNRLTSGVAMAWDSRDEDGPKMLLSQEFQFGQGLRLLNGWRVPGYLKGLGGLICRNRTPVCKMTGL